MEQLKSTGQMVGAQALVGIAGFAPPTLHAAAARTANDWSRRMFNLVVTNVPGPQFPLYAGGALMLGAYPVVPLAKGQAVSIGLTSYDGGMYFGLNADRDAMTDVDVLAECIVASLHELLDTIPKSGRRTSTRGPAPTTAPAARRAATAGSSSARPKSARPKAVPAAAGSERPSESATTESPPPPAVRPRQVSSSASRSLARKPRAASADAAAVAEPAASGSDGSAAAPASDAS